MSSSNDNPIRHINRLINLKKISSVSAVSLGKVDKNKASNPCPEIRGIIMLKWKYPPHNSKINRGGITKLNQPFPLRIKLSLIHN